MFLTVQHLSYKGKGQWSRTWCSGCEPFELFVEPWILLPEPKVTQFCHRHDGWMDEGRDRHGWIDMDGWTWVDGWIVRGMNATNERMQAGLSRRSSVARCTKVCSCVLLFVWVGGWTHGRTDARTHGRTDARTRGRMNRGGWRPLTSSRLLRASCAKARSFAPFLRRRTRFYASCWLVVWRLAAGDW